VKKLNKFLFEFHADVGMTHTPNTFTIDGFITHCADEANVLHSNCSEYNDVCPHTHTWPNSY
jgi:hypothetical protein